MSQSIRSHRDLEADAIDRSGTRVDIRERPAQAVSGWLGVVCIVAGIFGVWLLLKHSVALIAALVILVLCVILASLVIVQPGETRVVRFFGSYVGTVRRTGLWWTLPLSNHKGVSVRVRNFETNHLKVNDAEGNPVEIAAIVVWQVADTSRALYAVDDYLNFVRVQAESALRHVATAHPYDYPVAGGMSLRGSTDVVSGELETEVAERVSIAGVEIVEVRISHLAYASEIAQAMLRRQQANAVVAARSRIVDGAVGMVELALDRLKERDIVDLDEERKAAMVSNLMVVLCSDQPASPVVNTGTLYS
jgi:regulator of protease activity HflC (stomatin/prohibitin superfamily)